MDGVKFLEFIFTLVFAYFVLKSAYEIICAIRKMADRARKPKQVYPAFEDYKDEEEEKPEEPPKRRLKDNFPKSISNITCKFSQDTMVVTLKDETVKLISVKYHDVNLVRFNKNAQPLVDRCSNLVRITTHFDYRAHIFEYEDGIEILDYRVVIEEDETYGIYNLVNFDDCQQLRKAD